MHLQTSDGLQCISRPFFAPVCSMNFPFVLCQQKKKKKKGIPVINISGVSPQISQKHHICFSIDQGILLGRGRGETEQT